MKTIQRLVLSQIWRKVFFSHCDSIKCSVRMLWSSIFPTFLWSHPLPNVDLQPVHLVGLRRMICNCKISTHCQCEGKGGAGLVHSILLLLAACRWQNKKTGLSRLPLEIANNLSLFNAATGQQLWKGNGNKEIYSPLAVLVFDTLIWI